MRRAAPLVAVIGDCLLDIVVRRTARAAPGADTEATITLGPGGQAANLAVRLARRGRPVRLIAPVADDPAGQLVRQALAADDVELVAVPAASTGAVVALLEADGERAMASDRRALDARAAVAAVGAARWVHLSGYALLGTAGRELAEGLAALEGRSLSVNGGSAAADDGRAAELRANLAILRPALVVVDAAEAAALVPGSGVIESLGARLAEQLDAVAIVTSGATGASAAWPDGRAVTAAAAPARQVDATGAGDAFAAVLVDELADDRWPPEADRLQSAMSAAAALAAQVVGVVGAQTVVEAERRRTAAQPRPTVTA